MILIKSGKGSKENIKYTIYVAEDIIPYINTKYKDKIIKINPTLKLLIDEAFAIHQNSKIRESIFNKTFRQVAKKYFGNTFGKKVSISYWNLRGYDDQESITAQSSEQSKRAYTRDIESYKRQSATWRIGNHRQDRGRQFYLDKGFSVEKIENKIRSRNLKWKISMQKAIEKDPTINLRKGSTRDCLIAKFGEEKAQYIIKQRLHNYSGVSKIQLKFIDDIIHNCKLSTSDVRYNNQELVLYENGKNYMYDFVFKNKIIEFNGDFWHCNSKIYPPDFIHPILHITAAEIQQKDMVKKEIAVSKGYDYMTVWESEYLNTPETVIKKVKAFIKK